MHIHIHLHPDKDTAERLYRIEKSLGENTETLESIMTALDDELAEIKASQDATLATVGTIKTGVEALLAKLAALPTGGLTTDQQTALDAIRDEAQGISTAASAVNTEANPTS